MIRLEFETKKNLKEGTTDIVINLLIGDRKHKAICHTFETGLTFANKTHSKKIWDKWPGKEPLYIDCLNNPTINEFFNYQLIDIPSNLYLELTLFSIIDPEDMKMNSVELSKKTISYRLWLGHEDWPHDWSIKALFDEIRTLYQTEKNFLFNELKEELESEYSAFYFIYRPKEATTIKDLLQKISEKAIGIYQKAVTNLNEKFNIYPFKALFVFPDHIKYECEQYLTYFGQFLIDIGIESNTQIRQKGKEILFSVAPKNKSEAIEKINQAFSLFLTIPSLYNENIMPLSTGIENKIKFQRLESSITHLKSQLLLSEATISIQQGYINSLKEINENILAKSLIKIIQNDKESEGVNLFDGLLKVNKYKGKGFEFDIPKLILKAKEFTKQFIE